VPAPRGKRTREGDAEEEPPAKFASLQPPAPAALPSAPSGSLTIVLQDFISFEKRLYRLNFSTAFRKVSDKYEMTVGTPGAGLLTYNFGARRLSPTDTPLSAGLVDGSLVLVSPICLSGGISARSARLQKRR